MDEYLEKLAADGFKREVDQEENVVRSLPFFAAGLAIVIGLFSQIIPHLPPFGWAAYPLIMHALLVLVGVGLSGVMLALFEAVRRTAYLAPPDELEMIRWAARVRQAYVDSGATRAEVDAWTVERLRGRMTEAFAECAVHNRREGIRKLRARTRGLTLLIALLVLAFVMAATIFVHDRLSFPKATGGVHGEPQRQQGASGGSSGEPSR